MENSRYRSLTWYPVLAVGVSMLGFIMVKTGRDAVFFQDSGLRRLPMAYVWIAMASVPAAMMHLKALERWGARRTRTGILLVAASLFFLFVPFTDGAQRSVVTLLFVMVPTAFAAVFAGAWLLAGDILEGADQSTKSWAYSRIGAASMVGGILGGLCARGLSELVGPRYLIAAGAFVLVLVALVVLRAHRSHPIESVSADASPSANAISDDEPAGSPPMFEFLLKQSDLVRQPYVRALLGISGLGALAALYIDFQFYATTVAMGNNNAHFFASFYIVLNAVSLALQLWAAPWLQRRFGVGGALLLLPTALLGSAGVFSLWATAQARTVLKVTEGGLKSSIHRFIWEQAFLPIGRGRREVVKILADGMAARVSEGIGAAVLLIWLSSTSPSLSELSPVWLSWVITGTILLWIGLTRYLSRIGCSDIVPVETVIRLPDG